MYVRQKPNLKQMITTAKIRLLFCLYSVLLILIGYALGRPLIPVGGKDNSVRSSSKVELANSTTWSDGRVSYAPVFEANLYEKSNGNVIIDERGGCDEGSQTSINLGLRGIMMTNDDRAAHAIIVDGSGNEQVYFLDQILPGGGILENIQADRILIRLNGVQETLMLTGGAEHVSNMAQRPLANTGPATVSSEMTTPVPVLAAELIQPKPFYLDDKLIGYRVFPKLNSQLFLSLGLQPGDLVLKINEMELNQPQKAEELFRNLGESTQALLTLRRNGQQQIIFLDTSQLDTVGQEAL